MDTPEISVRQLLLLVADLKKSIKATELTTTERYKLYTQLHDLLADIVLLNYENNKPEGGGTNGRLQHRH